ncbi:hypothetical protein FOG51_03185 [Hanseniaspora uvarum]|jgi:F-type H+-transporting ATPase subunit b|uniref:ATP synthase subunit 4 n=1 Tax=Hanseniaspora uvarum TaxID=29833 RepID=A0A1E5RUQ0_HANUV|nr:hypothetical protein FOG48_01501 [Hanseniaspora uvarum]KAF0271804.1 hypothetical protein FOG51_03185 [Hanseniaspora uvarum]KAF0276221.1 hypothetical protein FOG50_02933 [Hanseniaspora uvarum]OEJ90641.1 ATP synthase subunit 4, mitochondrial [Hanseniaspora uvarum]GMM41758.1 F1F0 ATP synthase subunit 4 [Hanseniaspora uvarum]
MIGLRSTQKQILNKASSQRLALNVSKAAFSSRTNRLLQEQVPKKPHELEDPSKANKVRTDFGILLKRTFGADINQDNHKWSDFVSKPTLILSGVLGSIWVASSEVIVWTPETLLLASFFSAVGILYATVGPSYKQAKIDYNNFLIGKLKDGRQNHLETVTNKIDEIKALESVHSTTAELYKASKDTLILENETQKLQQIGALKSEIKQVLDSWVRHENNLKQEQQKLIAKEVIANVNSKITDKTFQANVLNESINELEALLAKK